MTTAPLDIDPTAALPEPHPLPLFPDLYLPAGVEPQGIRVSLNHRNGPQEFLLDAQEPEIPELVPGIHWLTVQLPPGYSHLTRSLNGGIRRVKINAPAATAASAPAAPSMDPIIGRALDRLAEALTTIDSRLRSLETARNAGTVGGAASTDSRLMEALLPLLVDRLKPSPERDPLEQWERFAGLAERFGTWQAKGGPQLPDREPSSGELIVATIEKVGEAALRLPGEVARARKTIQAGTQAAKLVLHAGDLARMFGEMSPAQLGDWLAEAIEAKLLPETLIEEADAGAILVDLLKLDASWKDRLGAALKHAAAQFEDDGAVQA